MEFAVRALRGWAVPLVIPVPEAWRTFDAEGRLLDDGIRAQLEALGAEVAGAAQRFSQAPMTDARARAAEAAIEPLEPVD
jgi:FMN reductase